MKEKEQFKHLYQLYLNNLCNAEELKQFFELLNRNRDDQEISAMLSDTWDRTDLTPETGLVPTFIDQPLKTVKLTPTRRSAFDLRRFMTAAAVLLVLTGIYFYRADIAKVFNPVAKTQLFSSAGERKQIRLADGTKVWLSPNSKLSYPDKFEGPDRQVSLEGEAFFEVTHDSSHPFIIKSGAVSTTVLGTSFNVSAYKQQHTINVTLVTGKVTVALNGQNNTKRDTIVANQQLIVDKITSSITKLNYPDAAAFLNRRLGLYEYRGAALQEVQQDLENQYNIKIELGPGLAAATFYGNLNMTDALHETLNKLCTVMETKWKKDGGHYELIK